jgi:hypothetical protein
VPRRAIVGRGGGGKGEEGQEAPATHFDGKLTAARPSQVAEKRFKEFIRNFQVGEEFPYRDQLSKNTNSGDYKLDVLLEDVMKFDQKLHDDIKER